MDAYKQQNRFLSSELAELNTVRTEDLVIYRTLEKYVDVCVGVWVWGCVDIYQPHLSCSKHHELEAEYYRIQSKHMILLQESQQPRMGEWVWSF